MTGCWILSGFEKWSVRRFVLWCMGSIRVTYSDIVLDTFWDDGAELEGSFVYHFVTLLAICFYFPSGTLVQGSSLGAGVAQEVLVLVASCSCPMAYDVWLARPSRMSSRYRINIFEADVRLFLLPELPGTCSVSCW